MSSIRPETGQFARFLGKAARALDAHLENDPGDAMRFDSWDSELKGTLPGLGLGADGAIERQLEVLLPNGPRMSHPGFWAGSPRAPRRSAQWLRPSAPSQARSATR